MIPEKDIHYVIGNLHALEVLFDRDHLITLEVDTCDRLKDIIREMQDVLGDGAE